MLKLLLILALLHFAVTWWRRHAGAARVTPPAEDADARTLRGLVEAGADLAKPTEVNFHLHLPSEGHAASAADVARREGFAAEVRPPVDGHTTWLCLASRRMVPERAAIDAAVRRLDDLATSFGGEFDGWEAAVTR